MSDSCDSKTVTSQTPLDTYPTRILHQWDFSIHGISQARILVWVAISFSRGSSRPTDQTCIFCVSWILGRCFTTEPSVYYFSLHFDLIFWSASSDHTRVKGQWQLHSGSVNILTLCASAKSNEN